MKPELLTHLKGYTDAGRYVIDPTYAMERKRDGKHLLIVRTLDGGSNVFNKHGEPTSAPDKLIRSIPPGVTLDGELEGSHWFRVFDILSLPGLALYTHPYSERAMLRAQLIKLISFHGAPLTSVETYYGEAKETMLMNAVEQRWEGVVFKKLDAAYCEGRAGQHVALKFVKTCTVRVRAVEPTRAKIEMYFADWPGWRDVCDGVSLLGKPPVKVGDYLEVEYLYASHHDRLVQPVMKGIRDDANDSDCGTDQLIYKRGDDE